MSRLKELLSLADDQVIKVRDKYGTNEKSIKEDIAALKEWLKKCPHLPIENDDRRYERMLVNGRFSKEKTKRLIESYYTTRSIYPECYNHLLPDTKQLKTYMHTCVIPMITSQLSRITVMKLKNFDSELYDVTESFSVFFMIAELRLCHDYAVDDILILDIKGFSKKHAKKFSPKVIKKLLFLQEAYGINLKEIHLIFTPTYYDTVLSTIKHVLPSKLLRRIHMHHDINTLYENVPKKYLPSDYGGLQKTVEEISNEWYEELEQWNEFFDERMKIKSNENLRIGKCHEFEIFGTGSQGSFKKFNLE